MPLATLYAIGDRHEQSQPILEQVAAISAYGDNTSGETATRTLLRQFRWSTDNLTFSSWATTTTAALSALVLDANEPLYLQFAWERTGSDASSLIIIHGYSLEVTTDPNAIVGRGMFTNTGIYEEMREFVPQVIRGFVAENLAGDPIHQVMNCYPLQRSDSPHKPLVYCYDYSAMGEMAAGLCNNRMEIRFRVGVKRVLAHQDKHYLQLGWVQSIFREGTWDFNTFSLPEFKGVAFPSARLQDFGITECRVTDTQERWAGGNMQDTYDEFGVIIAIEFLNLNTNLIN